MSKIWMLLFMGLPLWIKEFFLHKILHKIFYSLPIQWGRKMTGNEFVSGFLKCNEDLSLCKPQGVALNYIYGLNKTDVNLLFENLDSVLHQLLLNFIMFTTVVKLA